MERQAANGYVLTLSLLVAAYVRHLEDDDYEKQQAESSMLSADRSLERKTIARSSVAALAHFLLHEIQRPRAAVLQSSDADATTLDAVFQRLQRALDARPEDATVLTDEVLHVLASVDSPDAVGDVVDAIGECVAPLATTAAGEAVDPPSDATSALLVRKSVFGVFVRRFVLAVNRLLFDGLSRVFDEIVRYRDEFVDRQMAVRRGADGPSDISLSLTASPSTRFLWKQGNDLDDLPLSPIVGGRERSDSGQFSSLTLAATQEEAAETGSSMNTSSHITLPTPPPLNGLSRDQMQYYLHDTAQDLEQGLTLPLIGPNADRVLQPLQKVLDPDALFVKYLDAVNRREYEAALEALHRYHDIALHHTQRFRYALRARNKAAAAVSGGSEAAPATVASTGSGLHFLGSGAQYAALNLAGLHMAFDRFDAAQDAIQEAIRVAQHHGDHICVAFALSWFARVQLMQGKPRHQVAALVASALERADELSIPCLRVLVSLTALEHDMTLGCSSSSSSLASSATAIARFPSPRPLDLWSRLSDVDEILVRVGESIGSVVAGASNTGRAIGNLVSTQQQQQQLQQGGVANAARYEGKKSSGMTWKHSIEGVLRMMWSLQGKSRAAAAIGWQLYGARALGDSYDNVFWTAYKESASSGEIASWICRMVLTRVEWAADVDDSGDPAGQVQFIGAFEMMRDVLRQPELQKHQLLQRSKVLQRMIHRVLALWCINRGEFLLADAYIAQLISLSASSSDEPARVEALVLQSRLWGEREEYVRCLQQLDTLEELCHERGYEYVLAQVLILKSDYTRRSRAPHSPFDALPAILQAIEICRGNRYDLLLAEAHVVIAEMYIMMGRLVDATELLDQQMPLVMEHGSIQLRAETLLVLAKGTLAKANGSEHNPTSPSASQSVVDSRVVEWLDDSAALFSRLESWRKLREIAYLKTRILHSMSKPTAAADAAKSFLYYEQLLRRAQEKQSATVPITAVDSVQTLTRIVQDRRVSIAS